MRGKREDGRGKSEGVTPPGAGLIRAIRWMVPTDRREEWEAEWVAELAARWGVETASGRGGVRERMSLVAQAVGAVPDAIWMRKRHGSQPMLAQDLRLALRGIARRPAFSAVVVATLALGIGANAAIFSVVNAVLLRSLPYPEPERLVRVIGFPRDGDTTSRSVGRSSSFPDYADLRDQSKSFDHLAAYTNASPALLVEGQEPKRARGAITTWNLFPLLGVSPQLGRGFSADDDKPGAPDVVVLGHALWQSRFGGRANVVGERVLMDGKPFTVIGVMPSGFAVPSVAELWTPITTFTRLQARGVHSWGVLGRVKHDIAVADAETEATVIASRLEASYPRENLNRSARLEPFREALVQNVRPTLRMLTGAVALVLLIVCANLAGLFTSRIAGREQEAAVRTALGASRGQLVSQMLVESIVLALAGGAAGVLLANWGAKLLVAKSPTTFPGAATIGVDGTVLMFVLGVSVVAGIACGAIPAWHYSHAKVLTALKEAGRGARVRGRRGLRSALVVVEIALAVVLVIGAGLLVKSFVRLQQVDAGFTAENLLVVGVQLPEARYTSAEKRLSFFNGVLEQVKALPGVEQAVVALEHPLSPGWTSSFTIEEHPAPKEGSEPESRVRPVTEGYFRTVGVPLRAGRDIGAQDVAGGAGVVVINEAFAREHFPNENPMGKHLLRQPWWPGMPARFEIVGVAADEKFLGLQAGSEPATYYAFPQFTLAQFVIVRTTSEPAAMAYAVKQAVWSIDRALPIEDVFTMDAARDIQVAPVRFNASMLGLFGVVAMILAALGIYGVVSFAVTQRTGEIGIRVALGASVSSVVRLIVRSGMAMAAAGVTLGLIGAVLLTRTLSRLLFEVSALDTSVFVAVALLIAAVACAAAYVPARRAARVDPAIALRQE